MPNIRQAILIGATAENIYHAITSQEGLAGWWTPKAAARAELNSVARFPFGDNYSKEMRITEIVPLELVRWNCIKGADQWIGTTLSFNILAGDKATLLNTYPDMLGQVEQLTGDQASLLIFHHDDWRAETLMFAECSYTWGQFLRSLKLYCETGEGRPWPDQHRL